MKYKNLYNSDNLVDAAPAVVGGNSNCLRRFKLSLGMIDRGKHRTGVMKAVHAKNMGLLFVVDYNSHFVQVYDIDGKVHTNGPKLSSKHVNETKIIDIAYSESEKRLGAINTDYTMTFWDYIDGFNYESDFLPEQEHEQIYYLEKSREWMTVDRNHQVFIWDIATQSKEKLHCFILK